MELLLPREHLSWSQRSIWKQNKDRYRREYFENGKKLDSKYLRFGKAFAEAEELTDKDAEHEIRVVINGVPCLSYLDSYNPSKSFFDEKKTGKVPWTLAKVHKHEQLVFYATAIKWKYGKIPKYCNLIWSETEENVTADFWGQIDSPVRFTGNVIPFKRTFDLREIERMEKDILQTALEISKAYRAYLAEEL